jgi:hypothetical protein
MGTKNRVVTTLASLFTITVLLMTLAMPAVANAQGTGRQGGDFTVPAGSGIPERSRTKPPEVLLTLWRGEYFANPNLAGVPVVVQEDRKIDFDWGNGAPFPGMPLDYFSVRWTGKLTTEAGRYRFTTETDDGVRLYVDGRLLIDQWRPMPPTRFSAEVDLTAGTHTVRMEYFEATGGAVARLMWARVAGPEPITEWRGEYFNNTWLSGVQTVVRNDKEINFDWGYGSPDPRINPDFFSVRWTRNLYFEAGRYRLTTETDDGVRLFIDGNLVIDQWRLMSRTRYTAEIYLNSGVHSIRMEYFENQGEASARLTWEGPIPYPSRGNLITCVRPHNSWIKAYQLQPDGTWLDIKPEGWGAIDASGYLKIDGLPVDFFRYGYAGHPYRVELWAEGRIIRSVGNTAVGEPEFRIRPDADNYTPWGCPAP